MVGVFVAYIYARSDSDQRVNYLSKIDEIDDFLSQLDGMSNVIAVSVTDADGNIATFVPMVEAYPELLMGITKSFEDYKNHLSHEN